MTEVHRLSRSDARRIAVRAQLLGRQRPVDLHEVVQHLTLLQLEPTKALAVSAELVLWSRLGSSFVAQDLWDAVDEQSLIELHGVLRPASDLVLHTADMAEWPSLDAPEWQHTQRAWVETNNDCRREILALLRTDGPLPSRDLPDTCVQPWRSSGWNNNRNVRMMLDRLVDKGEVAVAGREGREPMWDLAERVYPDDPPVAAPEARSERDRRRLNALGIARSRATQVPVDQNDVGEAGEAAVVDGVRGEWRVDPNHLAEPGERFAGRAALLSPFDRLVYDRKRMVELFEFDYNLEMYKPAAQRRWGYYALPILYGDRLVGKLDATADRAGGVLHVDAIHEDAPFSAATSAAVVREIADLARWLELELHLPG